MGERSSWLGVGCLLGTSNARRWNTPLSVRGPDRSCKKLQMTGPAIFRYKMLLHPLSSCLAMLVFSGFATACQTLELASPDGHVAVGFSIDDDGRLSYGVSYRGKPVLVESRLGLALRDAPALDSGFCVVNSVRATHDETWKPVHGEHSRIRDHCNQLVVDLIDGETPPRKLRLVFRAYDEGAAFCYTIPGVLDNRRARASYW